jgi:hypothetical protein
MVTDAAGYQQLIDGASLWRRLARKKGLRQAVSTRTTH